MTPTEAQHTFAKAAQRLAEIKQEITRLQIEAREIDNALSVMRRFMAAEASVTSEIAETIAAGAKNATAQGFQMSQAEFEVLAEKALEQAARPLTRTQMLEWMERNGTPISGGDASKTAGTKFWRAREKFVNLRGSGYWFRDRPCPVVGYHPMAASIMEDPEIPADAA